MTSRMSPSHAAKAMTSTADTRPPHPIEKILEDRIAIIDGAMGTTIRTYGMTEADIRGERFRTVEEGSAEQRRSLLADPAGR